MATYADQIEADLRALGTAERAVHEKAYLKSPGNFLHFGVTVWAIRKVAMNFRGSHRDLSHDELIMLVEELWAPEVHETRMVAIELLNAHSKLLTPQDAALLERMLDESHTWAYVDNLAADTMGALVIRYPELNRTLDKWSKHKNFWLRRAAMLSLLDPLRKGAGDFERFGRYADAMLSEKEFFIRKAIGWILRDTARKRPEMVYEWLAPRAHRASTLTVREATRHMSKERQEGLVAAAKNGKAVGTE
jgi:3-methyladenine DNA glycosylase AlkD